MKEAVCALIRNEDLVLGVSRKDDPTDFGLPGGKVDPGEEPEEALIREVLEETGLRVTEIGALVYEDENTGYWCYTYEVVTEGSIDHDREAGVVKWVEPTTLMEGTFGTYNEALFDSLLEQQV